jgi:ankyrin repeat protein
MDRAALTGSASNAVAQDAKIAKFFVRNELALHLATKRGDDIEVERLLAFGRADVNETDRHGQTALHIAAFEGFTAVVDILIRKGIAIGSLDKNRWSPLHAASKEGHLTICERLLLEGADPTVPVRPKNHKTPHSSPNQIFIRIYTYDMCFCGPIDRIRARTRCGANYFYRQNGFPSFGFLAFLACF